MWSELVGESEALHNRPTPQDSGWHSKGRYEQLGPAFAAVVHSICVTSIRVAGSGGSLTHRLWLGPDSGAALLQVDGDAFDFFVIGPTFAPITVARLIGLSPRRRLPSEVRVAHEGTMLRLLDDDAGDQPRHSLADAVDDVWGEWSAEVRRGAYRAWLVETLWLDESAEQLAASVAGIDCDLGPVVVQLQAGQPDRLESTSSAAVWARLLAHYAPDRFMVTRSEQHE